MAFRFKHFTVEDDLSTLKVGTDAMLLGAWANPGTASRILDVGTGCGILALMMAQKTKAFIDAIDIDPVSVNEAGKNFIRSPWYDRIAAICESFQHFYPTCGKTYDFIISNPPYYNNQLKSPSLKANIARHDEGIKPEELLAGIEHLLHQHGSFAVIYPYTERSGMMDKCTRKGFYLTKQMIIHPRPAANPIRTLMEFSRSPVLTPPAATMFILDNHENFSRDYLALTADFHYF